MVVVLKIKIEKETNVPLKKINSNIKNHVYLSMRYKYTYDKHFVVVKYVFLKNEMHHMKWNGRVI